VSDIVERLNFQQENGLLYLPDGWDYVSWADAAAEIARLRAENERLREALLAWEDAVKIDVTMEGPRFMGIEHIRGKRAWDLTAAILEGGSDE